MARDDDDDRPRKKRRPRDEEDESISAVPRPKPRSRVEDDEDEEDRPRRRSRDDDDDDEDVRPLKRKKRAAPMPGFLLTMIIISMIWGGLGMVSNCWGSFSSIHTLMRFEQVDNLNAQLNALGGNFGLLRLTRGYYITLGIVHVLMLLMTAGTFASGVVLILRKSFGKYPAVGCPALAAVIDLVGVVAILVVTQGSLLWLTSLGYVVSFIFATAVCIVNVFGIMNKDVARVLK